MGDPITVKRIDAEIKSPMARLPQDEDFDCNESEWKGSVAGLTTFSLRNAASLGDVDAEEIEEWFSLFSADAAPIGSGRTWNAVAAHFNAARVAGNLVCREEDADDFQDNNDKIVINKGAQLSVNASVNPIVSIDIDNDFNTDEHAKMTSAMDAIKMPLWSDRLTYYFGAAMPQGFLRSLSANKIGKYAEVVKSVLSEANYGFVKTDKGWMEKMDGVLIFVSAVASEKHDINVFDSAMAMMGKLPGWEEFANVLYAGRAYREALGSFEQVLVAAQNKADTTELCTETRSLVDAALFAIEACDENLLNDDQKEVRFMIKSVLLEMDAGLDAICKPPVCGDGIINGDEKCDPKAKPTGCGDGLKCSSKSCSCYKPNKGGGGGGGGDSFTPPILF